jgi:hypothetical protein
MWIAREASLAFTWYTFLLDVSIKWKRKITTCNAHRRFSPSPLWKMKNGENTNSIIGLLLSLFEKWITEKT